MTTAALLYDRLKSRVSGDLPDDVLRDKARIAEEIIQLKKEKNVLILAHNYVDPMLFHTVPDITGDSLELSRRACEAQNDIILVCGVAFMAETAKILNPEKKVLIPVSDAGCSLAESITAEDVRALKKKHPGVPVAAYINTYADLKAEIDICCTSGNAEQVLRSLNDEKLIFLPDRHLGTNIATALGRTWAFPDDARDAEVIIWPGGCEVHDKFTLAQLLEIRSKHPDAVILAHPECPAEVAAAADFTGGTTAMIDYIQESEAREFCLFSEAAMEKNITLNDPGKRFIPAPYYRCPHMEKVTLENTLDALREERFEVDVPADIRDAASLSLTRMLQIPARG